MYYLLLFTGVFSLLSFVAWREPALRHVLLRQGALEPRPTGAAAHAVKERGAIAAQFPLKERKQEQPCLSPIDCVQEGKCAGHCGWR